MFDIACGRNYQVGRGIATRVKGGDLFLVKRRNCLRCTFDGTSQRMIGEVGRVESFSQEFVGRVFDHLHLFDDHFPLTLEIFFVKARTQQHIR